MRRCRISRRAAGAVRSARGGFTLIELLVVVLIISVLAAIALPRLAATRSKAHFAGMQSDLRNLTAAEEGFFYDHSIYTQELDSLHYTMSPQDSVTVVEASASGWSATATNLESSPHFCALYTGTAQPIAPAVAPGVIGCQ